MSGSGIGAFRRRLVAEEPVDVANASGSVARNFVARFSLWGNLERLNTQAQFVAGRDEAAMTFRIHLRANAALKAGWRLRLGARCFDILAIEPDETACGRITCRCLEIA